MFNTLGYQQYVVVSCPSGFPLEVKEAFTSSYSQSLFFSVSLSLSFFLAGIGGPLSNLRRLYYSTNLRHRKLVIVADEVALLLMGIQHIPNVANNLTNIVIVWSESNFSIWSENDFHDQFSCNLPIWNNLYRKQTTGKFLRWAQNFFIELIWLEISV